MTKDTVRNVLSGFIVGSFMGALAALQMFPIPEPNKDLIVFMLGQLSGFAGAVISFHFGTSKSSVDKNAIIHDAMPGSVPHSAAEAGKQVAEKARDEADRIAERADDPDALELTEEAKP